MADREGGSTPPHINILMQEFLRSQKSVISSISLLTQHVQEIRGDMRVTHKVWLSLQDDLAVLRGEVGASSAEIRAELLALHC